MENIFKKPKLKIVIISTACFLALTVILIVVTCANAALSNKGDDTVGAFAENTSPDDSQGESPSETNTEETSIYDHLIFEKNSSGGCTLMSAYDLPDTTFSIPSVCPHGDAVTAIGDFAFKNCTNLLEISIPDTVKTIGTGSFAGCSSLVAINVDTANTKYCSVGGVLFSKDKTELICYPCAKVGNSFLLSTNVKQIAPYAFDGVVNLKAILYEGSTSKYQSIQIGAGNQIFSSLPVTCNYVAAK